MSERKSFFGEQLAGSMATFSWREAAIIAAFVLILSPIWEPYGWMAAVLAGVLGAFAARWVVKRLDGRNRE